MTTALAVCYSCEMEIIGLSGYARSGKDEAANILVNEYGFTRVAFADKLREVLYALNPVVAFTETETIALVEEPIAPGPVKVKFGAAPKTIYVQEVIDTYGWHSYKESPYGPEVRRLLQRLGTESGRQTLWDSIWIDAAFAGLAEDAKVVVTDCRFPNEAQAVRERGGSLWRVNRAGVGPAVGKDGTIHPSETSLDTHHFDVVLFNDSSLETYQDNVRRAYESRANQ